MRKKVVAMGLAAMMAMSLAACSSGGSSTSTTAAGSSAEATTAAAAASSEESKKEEAKGDGKGYVVALCNYSIGNSWRAQMEQEFVSEAEKLKSEGVVSEYYITNSNEDINKQISDMQDLITKKVDAIVITAASPTALAPVVEEATEAGIKVVSFDNVVDTDEQVATVGIDETEFGRIGAEWLAEKLDGKQVEQAIDHIKHHYSESTLSIEDVARTVCLSTSYFSTIFKNETGITFTDYLIKIRMERAKNLLENTHMKMYEISSMTGYENAAYFSAAFKRYFGKSPSDVQNHR